MFSSLKVRTQLALGFGLLTVFVAVVSLAGYWGVSRVSAKTVDGITHDGDLAEHTSRARANTVKDAAADSLRSAAASIRQEIGKVENSELAQQAEQLARGMEKTAQYLSDRSFEQIGSDVTETVRRNPWRALGFAFFMGVITGIILGNERG